MKAFLAANVERDDLTDAPINPEWIIEGDPRARSAAVSSHDGDGMWVSVWECTAGRFRWEYEIDEVIKILDGHARLTDRHGRVVDLRPGDVANFVPGDIAWWEVPEYVRKVAIGTQAVSVPARVVARLKRVAARKQFRDVTPLHP
jgi:uncharacterized cupin superfamily protein